MKIIRIQDETGQVVFCKLSEDGSANKIEGDIFGEFSVTNQEIVIKKMLAPPPFGNGRNNTVYLRNYSY